MLQLPDINNIAPGVLDKLMNLYTHLKERKISFEFIALKFKDKALQLSIISLAQESNQYATEVCSQIYSLGGGVEFGCEPLKASHTVDGFGGQTDVNKIEEVCEASESDILILYKELLDDPFVFSGVRKMIQYQFNGFMYTISQLRLLQTSL